MDSVNKVSSKVSSYVNLALNFINQNKILSSVLGMLLVLYAAMAAPKLPKNVIKIFDNPLFKLTYMFLIAYLASKNPSVAIISAVALFVTIQTLSSHEVVDKVVDNSVSVYNSESNQETVPLSPKTAELIQTSEMAIQNHYNNANNAEQVGDLQTAEQHNLEALKQEIKIDSAMKAKQSMLAASEAFQNGDVQTAEYYQAEAVKQEANVNALVNAELHRQAALHAEQNGDLQVAQAHLEQAAKHEESVDALKQVTNPVQEVLTNKFVKVEVPPVTVPEVPVTVPEVNNVSNVVSQVPEPVEYDLNAATFEPSLSVPEVNVSDENKQTRCNDEVDIMGYEGSDYANI